MQLDRLSEFELQDFLARNIVSMEDVKLVLKWGTFGKNGDEPMRVVRLVDCDTDHLKAILRTQVHITQLYTAAIISILLDRGIGTIINYSLPLNKAFTFIQ